MAKVASLTSERAELRARIQSLTDDVLGYKSDLKHISTAKARAEDMEKRAIKGLRSVENELRVVKEEFHATREELYTEAMALDRAHRGASEAESSVARLAEECSTLRGDLHRRGGYDKPKGWSNNGVEGRGLNLMGLRVARFLKQGCQGFSGFGLQSSSS